MKTKKITNEPATGQERELSVELNQVNANCSVKLINKADKSVIMDGRPENFIFGTHFGPKDDASDEVKAAFASAVEKVESAVFELWVIANA